MSHLAARSGSRRTTATRHPRKEEHLKRSANGFSISAPFGDGGEGGGEDTARAVSLLRRRVDGENRHVVVARGGVQRRNVSPSDPARVYEIARHGLTSSALDVDVAAAGVR